MSVAVCVAALAFSLVVWRWRTYSPLGLLLTLVLLDMVAWNFADLAYLATRNPLWHQTDHFFATLMPGLAMHLVLRFVGYDRRWKPFVLGQYAVCLLLAAVRPSHYWWLYLFVLTVLEMSLAVVLLWQHYRRNVEPTERERTALILVAICAATILGVTDLWHNELLIDVPQLANFGMLVAIALVWVATIRARLLNEAVPLHLITYSSVAGAALVFCYLTAVRWLDPKHGFGAAFAVTTVAIGLATGREFQRYWAAHRQRAYRLTLLGRLSDQLAHDIRNPLAAMKGSIQFLMEEARCGKSLDLHTEFLGLMLNQVARLEGTVEHYQRLAKVAPEFQTCSLNELVQQTVGMQRFGVAPKVELCVELDNKLPRRPIDPDLVTLALENLLRNACEAIPLGGRVVVRTMPLDTNPRTIVLQVQDNGPGIDARTLVRVMDEYYTTKPYGTGLGLAFVRRVAAAHGGELRLQSVKGQGTTASIYLPQPETS